VRRWDRRQRAPQWSASRVRHRPARRSCLPLQRVPDWLEFARPPAALCGGGRLFEWPALTQRRAVVRDLTAAVAALLRSLSLATISSHSSIMTLGSAFGFSSRNLFNRPFGVIFVMTYTATLSQARSAPSSRHLFSLNAH
jgi:hypothetical protein